MGTQNALRQLLMSLCEDSHWIYAIFWQLERQSQMLLTWEDWYYDYSKPTAPVETFSDEILNNINGMFSRDQKTDICDTIFGDSIGIAVADMSRHQYTLGEGVVGTVAYTGTHCWVLHDDTFSGCFNSNFITEYPDEWLVQFAAGIKTILLVSVVPHGVVQLGSLETVAEDMALVHHIKERFKSIQGYPPWSQISISMGSLDSSTTTSTSLLNKLDFEGLKAVDSLKLTDDYMSALYQGTFVHEDVHSEEVPEIFGSPRKSKFGLLSMSFPNVPYILDQSLDTFDSEMMESNAFKLSGFEEELYTFSPCHNLGLFGEPPTENFNPYLAENMMEVQYINKDNSEACHRSASNSFKFPADCELHKALGTTVSEQINGCVWGSSASGKDAFSGSSFCRRDLIGGIQPLTWESSEWFTERGDVKQLLEDVISNVYSTSDDASSYRSNCIWSSTTSGQVTASPGHCVPEGGLFVEEDFLPQSHVKPAFLATGSNTSSYSSTSASSLKSMMTTLVEEEPRKNGHGLVQPKKLSNVSRKKAKTCNNHRPRPRDRQMIQDRIKELRELVPDSVKCSIDSLLDRTIKHMLFLKSVTVQAEKLRQCGDEEVASRKNCKSSKTEDGCENGISWTFELGTKLDVCPIVVEDLERPGHLLIEMICNDHKLFLEIAQVICNLELTILKGVMESRLKNTWAHFVVEASKGFHRVDIFLPLMQLFQRSKNSAGK